MSDIQDNVQFIVCGRHHGKTFEVLQRAYRRINQLEKQLAQVKKERDAAVALIPKTCFNCKSHLDEPQEFKDPFGRTWRNYCGNKLICRDFDLWEWCGIREDKTNERD